MIIIIINHQEKHVNLKIFHELTETDWPLEQLTKLKDDMMNELAEMRKTRITKIF